LASPFLFSTLHNSLRFWGTCSHCAAIIQKTPSVRLNTVSIFSKVFSCAFGRLQRQSNVQVAIGHAAFCQFRFAAFCRVRLDGCSVMPAPSKQALLPQNRRFSLTFSGNFFTHVRFTIYNVRLPKLRGKIRNRSGGSSTRTANQPRVGVLELR
jgi:hypothetical protein